MRPTAHTPWRDFVRKNTAVSLVLCALAGTSALGTEGDLLEAENTGVFLDSTEGLTGVEAPSDSVLGRAPASCRSGTGDAALRAGYREAQEGRRFISSFAFSLNSSYYGLESCPQHSPTRSDRMACRAYRGSEHRTVERPCCEVGFRAGITQLGQRIARTLRSPPADEGMRQCLRDFQRGEEFGAHFCPEVIDASSCHEPPNICVPTRFLNCFHLGAFSKMTAGACAGVEGVSREVGRLAPALNHRRTPPDRSGNESATTLRSSSSGPSTETATGGRAQ